MEVYYRNEPRLGQSPVFLLHTDKKSPEFFRGIFLAGKLHPALSDNGEPVSFNHFADLLLKKRFKHFPCAGYEQHKTGYIGDKARCEQKEAACKDAESVEYRVSGNVAPAHFSLDFLNGFYALFFGQEGASDSCCNDQQNGRNNSERFA